MRWSTAAPTGEGPLSSLIRNTRTRSGMSPEVGGFNDEVVVVALQVAVLPAENVQHLHHQTVRERERKQSRSGGVVVCVPHFSAAILLLLLLFIQP